MLILAAGSFAGLVGAHLLDYRLLIRSAPARAQLLRATGHAYLGRALEFAVAAAIVAAIASFATGLRSPARPRAIAPLRLALSFASIQSGGFVVLEALERFASHSVGSSFAMLTVTGIALQCIVGALLSVAVRALGAAGAFVASKFARAPRRTRPVPAPVAAPALVAVVHPPVLAFGVSRRGPPSLAA
jgi:hypothetical protein